MVLSLIASCAGANLTKFAEESELPDDLSQEFKSQFTVREEGRPSASPSPSASIGAAQVKPSSMPSGSKNGGRNGSSIPNGEPSETSPSKTTVGRKNAGKSTSVSPVSAKRPDPNYPLRRPAVDPIWQGEMHHFNVEYLGVKVGDCNLEVMPPKVISNRRAYHVKGHGWSTSMFSLVYRINDRMETMFDFNSFVSHKFRLMLDESKQTRDSQELNDPVKKQTFFWNRLNTPAKGFIEKKVFTEIPPLAQDSLSVLYFLRTLPLKDGDHYVFPMVSEGKILDATADVIGREDFDSPMGRVRAIKIKPEVRYHGILKKAGDSFIWMTDDDRRFILRMEARVKIGTVTVDLTKLEPGSGPISEEAPTSSETPVRSAIGPTSKVAIPEYYR